MKDTYHNTFQSRVFTLSWHLSTLIANVRLPWYPGYLLPPPAGNWQFTDITQFTQSCPWMTKTPCLCYMYKLMLQNLSYILPWQLRNSDWNKKKACHGLFPQYTMVSEIRSRFLNVTSGIVYITPLWFIS